MITHYGVRIPVFDIVIPKLISRVLVKASRLIWLFVGLIRLRKHSGVEAVKDTKFVTHCIPCNYISRIYFNKFSSQSMIFVPGQMKFSRSHTR